MMTGPRPVSTQTALDDPLEKQVGSVGRVHPQVEIKIVDPASGAVVPRGTPGELCTRGYSVMLGYWNNDEATRGSIDAARWMHTGDLATMDEEGYLNIVGRIKDMIIRGGENIYPREIEGICTRIRCQRRSGDRRTEWRYGEERWPGQGARPRSNDDLDSYCRGKIATYKIPRYWKLVVGFPMTVTGKIQKFRMREQAVEELGLQSEAAIRMA
jgi:fatty-acyl-CoA synthase